MTFSSNKKSHCSPALCIARLFITALLLFPPLVRADSYAALTLGNGPNDYRSYALRGNTNLSESLQLNLDYFLSKVPGSNDSRQAGIGFSWQASNIFMIDYRHSKINDGTVDVKGNEGGLTIELNPIWEGDLRTALDMGYGDFKYSPENPPAGTNPTLTQNSSRIGINQEITPTFNLYLSREKYKYDRNVILIAQLLIMNRNFSKAANLLAFPDEASTLGVTWKPIDDLNLNLSTSKTITMLNQELRTNQLGLDYQVNDRFNIGAAIVINSSSDKKNKAGTIILQKGTRDIYREITVGMAF